MESIRFPSRGGFSVRSIVTFVLTVVITALLWVILSSHPSFAQSETTTSADKATWNGASLTYDGNQYISTGKSQGTESHHIPKDATIYAYVEPAVGATTDQTPQKGHVIYFAPGADPPTATSATYLEYTYVSSTQTYSNPTGKKTIAIDPSTANTGGTSCAIEGIGYIVCPVTNFLAWGMDSIFDIMAGFMKVQPLQTGAGGGLYEAWNIMRGVANIAFIIVFLIIIYSQLTSIGVSNYGLKRLIPRLIIAAIAVNASYIICAIAVDLSNILGYSLQDVFLTMRNQVFGTSTDGLTQQLTSWQSVAGFVLSGGTAALALGVGATGVLVASGGSVIALIFILLPSLVGLLLTLLVVLLVLAARQALITILVIIAPLAIVAYLLPNTEKWFEKWRSLLMTMLIFFPAFSVVFGGSQLAGAIIIYNADSINMLILGMIVQVAPLVITPLLLRFSGSLLGRIAQIANNPNKGLLDRTRNWSKAGAEENRKRGISGNDRKGNPGVLTGKNFVRRSARHLDQRKMLREDRMKNADTGTRTAYENSKLYNKYDLAGQTAAFEADKEATHSHHAGHVERLKVTPGSLLHDRAINAQAQKEYAERSQNTTATYYNEQRITNGTMLNNSMNSLETSKSLSEASEQNKAAYLNEQRTVRATQLGAAAERLEATKLNAEGWQSKYTAHIDGLKLSGGNVQLGSAARFAQSSKEHAQAAQHRVEAMFDIERSVSGSDLNASMIKLKEAEYNAAGAKSAAAKTLSDYTNDPQTRIHRERIFTEAAKLAEQVSETALNKTIEEYKTGEYAKAYVAGTETVMEAIAANTVNLSAQSRGVQSAQNIQQGNIAKVFTATVDANATQAVKDAAEARKAELLDMAASVDEYGGVRAEAFAISTLNDINNKTRTANESLLEERALLEHTTPMKYAKQLVEERLKGDMDQSEDVIKAAMEILGKEAQIPIIRRMRMSGNFNQDDLSEMLLRNNGTMKAKGGFDLQGNPDLAGATQERMDASTGGMLGSFAPESLPDMKFIAALEYSNTLDRIITNTEDEGDDLEKQGVLRLYENLTVALKDPMIRRRLGDNLIPSVKMHMKLHRKYNNPNLAVDYSEVTQYQFPPDFLNE